MFTSHLLISLFSKLNFNYVVRIFILFLFEYYVHEYIDVLNNVNHSYNSIKIIRNLISIPFFQVYYQIKETSVLKEK